MRKHCKALLVAVIGAILMGAVLQSAALAAPVTQSVSYNAISIPIDKTDWISALVFPKFDPSKGNLVGVKLDITGRIETTLTVTNTAESASDGHAETHVLITVTDPGALLTLMPDIYSPSFGYTLDPGQWVASGLLTKNVTDSGYYNSAAILNEFTGPGDISLGTKTFTETVLSNTGGNTEASQITQAGAEGVVTYYFVPEPTGIMALLVGLSGSLGLVLRKRR